MEKKHNWLAYILISLAIIILAVWVGYFVFYQPSANKSASYIEVFQEADSKHVNSLSIECVDHKVVFLPSTDDKVKLTYFQKSDNSIQYTANGNSIVLKMVERSEDLDNLFYQSKRKIDTITVYIPENTTFNANVTTVDGPVIASDITLNSFHFNSINGNCDVNYINVNKLSLVSNYGNVVLRNSWFDDLSVGQVTGNATISILDSLNNYNLDVADSYGNLWVNSERIHQQVEGIDNVINYLKVDNNSSKRISINGIRNTINLNSVEASETTNEGQEN